VNHHHIDRRVAADDIPLVEPARLFWRLPVIRHIRAIYHAWQIAKWNAFWGSLGMIPQGFDRRVLRQVWRGIV
jgi:hypothetical protein